MDKLTIELPAGLKAENKWQDGQDTKGKFYVSIVEFEPKTVSGVAKDKNSDGTTTERPWSYEQLAHVSDGRKAFSGGKCIGTDNNGRPITDKRLIKLMPKPSDNKSSPAISKAYSV
jgi:hypothetical protein